MNFIKTYGGSLRRVGYPNTCRTEIWLSLKQPEVTEDVRPYQNCFTLHQNYEFRKSTTVIFFWLRQTKGKPDITAGMLLDSKCVKNLLKLVVKMCKT